MLEWWTFQVLTVSSPQWNRHEDNTQDHAIQEGLQENKEQHQQDKRPSGNRPYAGERRNDPSGIRSPPSDRQLQEPHGMSYRERLPVDLV